MLTIQKYSKPTRIWHWVSTVIIITLISLGIVMTNMTSSNTSKFVLYNVHKVLGVFMLCIVPLRFTTRLYYIVPRLPFHYSIFEKYLSYAVHYALYLFTFLTALSGYVMSSAGGRPANFFGYKIPMWIGKNPDLAKSANQLHSILAYTLLTLIILHILGTLKHAFIDKDKPLQRII